MHKHIYRTRNAGKMPNAQAAQPSTNTDLPVLSPVYNTHLTRTVNPAHVSTNSPFDFPKQATGRHSSAQAPKHYGRDCKHCIRAMHAVGGYNLIPHQLLAVVQQQYKHLKHAQQLLGYMYNRVADTTQTTNRVAKTKLMHNKLLVYSIPRQRLLPIAHIQARFLSSLTSDTDTAHGYYQ